MDLQEALARAIGFERQVADHYADCACLTRDPIGVKVFDALAREEQGHVAYLQALSAQWQATGLLTAGELPSGLPAPAWLREAAEQIALHAEAPGGCAGQPGRPELAFLEEALALELKTSAFYQDLVAELAPEYRELFSGFLTLDDGHAILIQAELDALVGHGHWFDFTAIR